MTFIWGKISKNGPSKICERQPLKNFKWYGLSSTNFTWSILGPFLNFILLDIFSFQKSIACLLKYYVFLRDNNPTRLYKLFYTLRYTISNKAKGWISKQVFQENKARNFQGKFDVLCFLETPVLRFFFCFITEYNIS